MLITQERIRRLIPHAGSMCLIDRVLDWDGGSIRCESSSHRDPRHPLARDGRLAGVHALEYGAQAAAIHGGLIAAAPDDGAAPAAAGEARHGEARHGEARHGGDRPQLWLAAVKDAVIAAERLDDRPAPLAIEATLLVEDAGNAIYRCRIAAAADVIASGRLLLMRRPENR